MSDEESKSVPLRVVQANFQNIQDIPAGLRRLAANIEAGQFDAAHNIAWVIDCGHGRVEVGLLGSSPSPGAELHHLLCCGAHKIVKGSYSS